MNLIIDAGNTAIKLAVFDKNKILFESTIDEAALIETVKSICKEYPDIDWAIVAAVRNLKKQDTKALSSLCQLITIDHNTRIPFKNLYGTPHTLGVDRIALATAAFYHNPKKNTLVIDAGTCITYDLINDKDEYLGGAISPGLQMRYKALHNQTSKLPLLEKKVSPNLIGNSTEESIHSGVIYGICTEIDGLISQYHSRYADLTVILTGGDSQFLSKRLKNTIFADSKFLMLGLNHLLEYNKR